MNEKLDEYVERAGAGATIMISEADLPVLRKYAPIRDWRLDGAREFYRGANIEVHDEWSWGWMVRKADGTYVGERDSDAAAIAAPCEDMAVPKDQQARPNGIAQGPSHDH